MKKIITLLMLAAVILAGSMTVDAKTKKKKSKGKNNSAVIGKFKYSNADEYNLRYNVTFALLSNGKIRTSSKCLTGNYEKLKGAYKVNLGTSYSSCGESCWTDLIVGDDIYSIGGGTDEWNIWEYNYNNEDDTITFINHMGEENEKEFLEYNQLPSLTVPLSHFEKVGKVIWMK